MVCKSTTLHGIVRFCSLRMAGRSVPKDNVKGEPTYSPVFTVRVEPQALIDRITSILAPVANTPPSASDSVLSSHFRKALASLASLDPALDLALKNALAQQAISSALNDAERNDKARTLLARLLSQAIAYCMRVRSASDILEQFNQGSLPYLLDTLVVPNVAEEDCSHCLAGLIENVANKSALNYLANPLALAVKQAYIPQRRNRGTADALGTQAFQLLAELLAVGARALQDINFRTQRDLMKGKSKVSSDVPSILSADSQLQDPIFLQFLSEEATKEANSRSTSQTEALLALLQCRPGAAALQGSLSALASVVLLLHGELRAKVRCATCATTMETAGNPQLSRGQRLLLVQIISVLSSCGNSGVEDILFRTHALCVCAHAFEVYPSDSLLHAQVLKLIEALPSAENMQQHPPYLADAFKERGCWYNFVANTVSSPQVPYFVHAKAVGDSLLSHHGQLLPAWIPLFDILDRASSALAALRPQAPKPTASSPSKQEVPSYPSQAMQSPQPMQMPSSVIRSVDQHWTRNFNLIPAPQPGSMRPSQW